MQACDWSISVCVLSLKRENKGEVRRAFSSFPPLLLFPLFHISLFLSKVFLGDIISGGDIICFYLIAASDGDVERNQVKSHQIIFSFFLQVRQSIFLFLLFTFAIVKSFAALLVQQLPNCCA